MKKYTVTIYESLTHGMEVWARNSDEAQDMAREQYLSAKVRPLLSGVSEYAVEVDDLIFEVDGAEED